MATPPFVYDDITPFITYDSTDISYDGDNMENVSAPSIGVDGLGNGVWAWFQGGM